MPRVLCDSLIDNYQKAIGLVVRLCLYSFT
jgi:hypothetical protein